MNTKASIARYYAEKEGPTSIDISNKSVVIDWGEPRCWACGYDPVMHDTRSSKLEDLSVKKKDHNTYTVWNRAYYLERAHVIPKALGGPDDPSNIVLLCSTCHSNNPHTRSVRVYQAWFDSVEDLFIQKAKVVERLIKAFSLDKQSDVIEAMHSTDFQNFLKFNTSQGAALKAGGVNETSLAGFLGALSEYLDVQASREGLNPKDHPLLFANWFDGQQPPLNRTESAIQTARAKKDRGEYTGGKAPLGWIGVKGTLQLLPNEEEQELIELVRKLRSKKMTYREIAQLFKEEGRVARKGHSNWSNSMIRRLEKALTVREMKEMKKIKN